MVRPGRRAQVVRDPSGSYDDSARSSNYRKEWRNFMESSISDMYNAPVSTGVEDDSDSEEDVNIKKMLKEVQKLGASNMTWKERKYLENKNIVNLGGKPVKKQRTPLSVAKPAMKNRQKREEKQLQEDRILGKFTKNSSRNVKEKKRRPEERVLKSTEGRFSKGVLDVKHLLNPKGPKRDDTSQMKGGFGMKKGKGNGKGKGKGKKNSKRKGR